jgi:hypothetical protein
MRVEVDERGPFVAVGFERADEARARLVELGIPFHDASDQGAGCAGPVWAELRLDLAAWESAGRPAEL